MSLAKEFLSIFRSHPNVYGRTEVTEGFDENGKANSKSWLQKEELTEEVWEQHLAGKQSIGCVPIKPNNMVSWGAIDIDLYQEQLNMESILRKISEASLPFVLCRSKSGGGHLYLFLENQVLAKHMVEKLEKFAAYFGQGGSEIFPKQVTIGKDENDADYGNWINMPYNGETSLRYALNESNERVPMEDFPDYCKARMLTTSAFKDLDLPEIEEILPEGPPCLNYIFKERADLSEMRNITLSNAAVYLKKAYGDEWPNHLNTLNQKFSEPLGDRELEAIKKSYEKKDYRYQCSKEPLCHYCDSRKCKAKQFGIGKDEIVPSNRSLTKLNTDPPLWYITIDNNRIALTTDQLFNFTQFNKRCLEILNRVFQPYKQSEWLENLASIVQNCTVIDIPEELTEKGVFHEILQDFLFGSHDDESPQCLIQGIPWRTPTAFYFRRKDLQKRLDLEKFKDLKGNEITNLLKQKYEGQAKTQRIGSTTVHCWKVPSTHFQDSPELELLESKPDEPF